LIAPQLNKNANSSISVQPDQLKLLTLTGTFRLNDTLPVAATLPVAEATISSAKSKKKSKRDRRKKEKLRENVSKVVSRSGQFLEPFITSMHTVQLIEVSINSD
jgi:hypothetical protein